MEPIELSKGPFAAGIATRSEGYQNNRSTPDAVPFPESQTTIGNMSTSLATGTGTITWTRVDCSSVARNTTELLHCSFKVRMAAAVFASQDAVLEVRRDDQVDSAVITAADMYTSSGDSLNRLNHFTVPLTMGAVRSFDYRIVGTLSTSAAWSITALGDTTRKRNTADAGSDISGSGGGSGGGNGFDSGGAGL
jgi:hypothetical protein